MVSNCQFSIVKEPTDKKPTLKIEGKFTYKVHTEFREVVKDFLTPEARGSEELVLDLTNVHYIDSSGLGMLLMYRDKAFWDNVNRAKMTLRIRNPGHLCQVLEIANFHKVFNLEQVTCL